MRARLAKLAATSARLRAGVKTAGIVDTLGKGAKALWGGIRHPISTGGKAAMTMARKYPLGTAAGVGTVGVGTVAGVGSYRKHRTGFDEDVQKQMLGQTPVPPGSE